jgi:hypothetical protein
MFFPLAQIVVAVQSRTLNGAHCIKLCWSLFWPCRSWRESTRPQQYFIRAGEYNYAGNGPAWAPNNLAWKNSNQEMRTRVKALVSSLTVPEKTTLFSNYQQPISRLGIPGFDFWSGIKASAVWCQS